LILRRDWGNILFNKCGKIYIFLGAGGFMCGDGEGWVYYRSESENWYLYKAKLDGSNNE
jgi:hypothetical protein